METTRKSKICAQVSHVTPCCEIKLALISLRTFFTAGVAYCQIMNLIFPNCINLSRVKISAKLEHECLQNMKLFQGALTQLKLDKTIPVDRLIKGRFQDNFEFLQWFKKFYDSQAPGFENNKSAVGSLSEIDLISSIEELNMKSTGVIEARDRAYNKLRKIESLLTKSAHNNELVVELFKQIRDVLYNSDEGIEVGDGKHDTNNSAIDC